MKQYSITKEEAGQRLLRFLEKLLPHAPKGLLHKSLRKKNITLNGAKADGHEKLKEKDTVSIFFSDETITKFSDAPISAGAGKAPDITPWILYEDEHILLADKPAGLLTQGDTSGEPSLNDALLAHSGTGRSVTPSICNRLDRNTSGLVICGKTAIGLKTMNRLLKERTIGKWYLAIAYGRTPEEETLTGFLSKDSASNQVTVTKKETDSSRAVETGYRKLKDITLSGAPCSLLEIHLVTGRPHQIRAHLSSIGHPLLGDRKYGSADSIELSKKLGIPYQRLHAWKLVFPAVVEDLPELAGREFTSVPPWAAEFLGEK